MAKRGPGRPKSAAGTGCSVRIINNEVPPKSVVKFSSRKRKTDTGTENTPIAKRSATVRPEEEVPGTRKSTRLPYVRASTQQLQRSSSVAEQKQSQEVYEVSTAESTKTSRVAGSRTKAGKVKQVRDQEHNTLEAETEEDLEDAANTLMTLSPSNVRNYAKLIRRVRQTKDGARPVLGLQPVTRGQRPLSLLTKGTTSKSNALLKPQSAPSRATKRAPAQPQDPGEHATLAVVISGRREIIEGNKALMNEAHQESQNRTPPTEEPVDHMEDLSANGQHSETAQLASADEVFEEAFSLYDCKENWKAMLKAAKENLVRGNRENRASEIRELISLVKDARAAYRAIRTGCQGNMEDLEFAIEKRLLDIDRRIRTIRVQNEGKTNAPLINDIYVQGIPKMIQLLKMALVTRSQNGELSVASLEELVQIIGIALNLCEKAYYWRPLPMVKSGVKRRTRNVIKTSLDALRRAYTEAQYDPTDGEAEPPPKAAKRRTPADHVSKSIAQEQEKRKRCEHNKRGINLVRHRRETSFVGLVTDVFGIADLELNDPSPAPAPNDKRRSLPWRETGVAVARRSLPSNISLRAATRDLTQRSQELTEDVTGPMAPDWSQQEDEKLLHGLELFTGANRYLEIDRLFGSAGGPLSGRDVDELMRRAKFLKQTMASGIEGYRKRVGNVDLWAFLLSVEG